MTTLTTRLVSFLRVMCLVGMLFPFNAFTAKYCLEIFAFPGEEVDVFGRLVKAQRALTGRQLGVKRDYLSRPLLTLSSRAALV